MRQLILHNQKGLSLTEALIGVALIGIVALLSTQFGLFSKNQSSQYRRACESLAQSAISRVQEEGIYRDVVNFIPTGGNVTRRANNRFLESPARALPNASAYWSSSGGVNEFIVTSRDPDNPGTRGPQFSAAHLIQGSIRTLTSIYNNNANLRCNYATYGPLNANNLDLPSNLSKLNPVVEVRLQPFNIQTGATVNCPSSLHIAPRPQRLNDNSMDAFAAGSGNTSVPFESGFPQVPVGPNSGREPQQGPPSNSPSPPNMANNYRMAVAGAATRDRGIIMTTRVRFNYSGDGGAPVQMSCEASQRFQYPPDRNLPPPPNVIEVVNNSTDNYNLSCVAPANPRTFRVRIARDSGWKRGSQFLCRDLSYRRQFRMATNTPRGPSVPCVRSNTNVHNNPNNNNHLIQIYDPRIHSYADRVNDWVACDRLSQCGRLPTSVNPSPDTTPNNDPNQDITLTYQNLPLNCVAMFEVVTVDPAGNISAQPTNLNRRFLRRSQVNTHDSNYAPMLAGQTNRSSTQRLDNQINKPKCGHLQPSNPYYNIYYVRGAGVYCKEGNNPNNPQRYETFYWTNAWRNQFPNGYFTCRGASGFGSTQGSAIGCCVGNGCTPFN